MILRAAKFDTEASFAMKLHEQNVEHLPRMSIEQYWSWRKKVAATELAELIVNLHDKLGWIRKGYSKWEQFQLDCFLNCMGLLLYE